MIVAVPDSTPDITPDVLPAVAIVVDPLLQIPRADVLLNVVVEPVQTVAVPVIVEGVVFTACIRVAAVQPLPKVYVIIVVPAVTGVIVPDELPIVATAVALLLQFPPASGSVSVSVLLVHTTEGPDIAPGVWFTVTVVLAGVPQPLA